PEFVSARPPYDEWPVDVADRTDGERRVFELPPEDAQPFEPEARPAVPRHRALIAAVVALVLLAASLGAVGARALQHRLSPPRPSVTASPAPATAPTPTFPPILSAPPPTAQPATPSPPATLDTAALAAKVDPAVVDVTSALASGEVGAGTGMVLT